MPHANVEIARRGVDAFNRRDVDGFLALTTADYEWVPAMGAVEGEIVRGREGVEAYFRSLRDAWKAIEIVAEEYRDLGDRVLVLGRVVGTGSSSGLALDASWATIVEFRDRRISRSQGFFDHADALRAGGFRG